MKFTIFVLCALTVVWASVITEQQKNNIRANAMHCTRQEGNTMEQAIALRNGNFENADEKAKCFANCFLERAGFLVDGRIQEAAVRQKLAPSAGENRVRDAIAACDVIRGVDKCETGFQIYRCFHRNKAWA